MKKPLVTIALMSLTAPLLAQQPAGYQCSVDEVTRRVVIYYETGGSVPCEVHYYKDTEEPGVRQVLWRARNEEGFCEARASEFVDKLRSMGWTCWEASETGDEERPDDTEALAPADEIEITEEETPTTN